MTTEYETIIVTRSERVATIEFNRPKAYNALNSQLMAETVAAALELDRDPGVGAIVLRGNEKAFAAGADIKEMSTKGYEEAIAEDFFSDWDRLQQVRTPLIAAVSGYALGGGCEVAMMCDMLLASESAKFGQPEINLGVIPGIGGSQRLTRAVGKAKAMDLCLTGRQMDVHEAERAGLVSRILPVEGFFEAVDEIAHTIANGPKHAAMTVTEAVDRAFETSLTEGVKFERRTFHALFATADQKEGMAAFVEKRPANWTR